MSLLALMSFGGLVLAHGSGGDSSGSAARPGMRFNIAPGQQAAVVHHAQPVMDLAVEGQTVILRVSDADGEPVVTEFADAKAFVTAKGKISTFYLWPAGANTLSGSGDFSPDPALRIEIKLNLPDQEPVNKEFYPFKK